MPKVTCLQSHSSVKPLLPQWHILKPSHHVFPMTSLLQTHSYTVVTKALHTSKIKQPYMILSKKVSCYDLPENISVSSVALFCPAIHCIFTSPAIPQGTKAEHSFQDANILLLIFWSPQKEKPRDILFFCFSTTSSGITGAHVGS